MTQVLLATDADWLYDEVSAALAEPGTTVSRIREGRDVSDAVSQLQPDLVMLDLQIGNMGGVAACLAVRQREEMGDIEPRPVALLLDREVDTFLANEARADTHLVKPLNAFQILRAVESLVAQEPSSA